MRSRTLSLPRTRASLLLAVLLMTFGVASPAYAATKTESNVQNVTSTSLEIQGTASADADSTAISGPTVTFSHAMVHQQNVQVIAGPAADQDNVSQNATNTADVLQGTVAATGTTDATNGGHASSGTAVAGSLTLVQQMNIQIIAGHAPEDGVSQDASNDVLVDQSSTAVSGTAQADGDGSAASSGKASSLTVAVVQQRNLQVYVGDPIAPAQGFVEQTAANAATIEQDAVAASGQTQAQGASTAASGNVKAQASATVDQTTTQVARD